MHKKHLKNSTSVQDKNSPQIGNRRYLNKIKVIYNKPTGNIILNSKRLKAFPLRSKTRQGCPLLFNIVMEILTKAIRQKKGKEKRKKKKEIKGIHIRIKIVFADDMILYIEHPKDSNKKCC